MENLFFSIENRNVNTNRYKTPGCFVPSSLQFLGIKSSVFNYSKCEFSLQSMQNALVTQAQFEVHQAQLGEQRTPLVI